MITEKMLELLLLYRILNDQIINGMEMYFDGKLYNADEMTRRYLHLAAEFLEPYVIDSNPKG